MKGNDSSSSYDAAWFVPVVQRCSSVLNARLFIRKRNVHYKQTNKGPRLMQLRGPFTCKSSLISILRVSQENPSMDRSCPERTKFCRGTTNGEDRGLAGPSHPVPLFVAFRSDGVEAHRPDPAQTVSRCSDHLHPGGCQTQRRQVNNKVGDFSGTSNCSVPRSVTRPSSYECCLVAACDGETCCCCATPWIQRLYPSAKFI